MGAESVAGPEKLAREVYRLCVGLVSGDVSGVMLVDAYGVRPIEVDAPGPAVALQTSGSASGLPRWVLVPVAALHASAVGTSERLGGPGRWISCLPAQFVGGFQVLFRSALAGIEPLFLSPGRGLPDTLARSLSVGAGIITPRHLSVVPAQLRALLDHPGARAVLAGFAGVLVGGDALRADLRAEAEAAGVPVVPTYGMTETCGGCVYDGVPLSGLRVMVRDDGRVLLAGPQLVAGYLEATASPAGPSRLAAEQPFEVRDGDRWLVTGDTGTWDGRILTVQGRADDVIVSGGRNVPPLEVEDALRRVAADVLDGWDWAVSSVPDPTWGAVIVLAVAPRPDAHAAASAQGATSTQEVLTRCAGVPSALRPRRLFELESLPRTESGKLDRRRLAQACAAVQPR